MSIVTADLRDIEGGYDKQIEESAKEALFDMLQILQYNYPERSTIRELVSNGLDSIKEKEIAIAILSGSAQEEDYFLRRDDPRYKDSNFDPTYYNLQYLNTALHAVSINYYEGPESSRDRIEITDYGVGLGGRRLADYFNLGYSSKRNTKFALGKFGIGAKSPLSTGVDAYYMESAYNGFLTKWNIYSAKINSLVPRLNLTMGRDNESIRVGTMDVYAELTDLANYTKVVLSVKKHKRQTYIDAVKQQLMYFQNVEFFIHSVDGEVEQVPVKARILFEDERVIVSKDSIYNKPHILINGVNYGPIDFESLEMENKRGSVGIKIPAEELAISPSRESVIWNDITRTAVSQAFLAAAAVATTLVNKELKSDDFLGWQRAVSAVRGRVYNMENEQTAIGILAGIVDVEKLDFNFREDPTLGADTIRSLWGIAMDSYYITSKEVIKEKKKIKRTVVEIQRTHYLKSSAFADNDVILYTKDSGKELNRIIRYLLNKGHGNVHVLAHIPNENTLHTAGKWLSITMNPADYPIYCGPQAVYDVLGSPLGIFKKIIPDKNARVFLHQQQEKVFELIQASTLVTHSKDVQVPEDFKYNFESMTLEEAIEEEVIEDITPQSQLTAAEYRKLNERVHVFTPTIHAEIYRHSVAPKLSEMNEWIEETYYATRENWELMKIAALISTGQVRVQAGYKKDQGYIDKVETPVDGMRLLNYVQPDSSVFSMPTEEWQERCKTLRTTWDPSATFYFNGLHIGFGDTADPMDFQKPCIRLICVAKDQVAKLPAIAKPIEAFFANVDKNNQLVMSELFAKWYLARKAEAVLDKLSSYVHVEGSNSRINDLYSKLSDFKYSAPAIADCNGTTGWRETIMEYMDKVMLFQQSVSSHKDEPELIAAMALEMFGNSNIEGTAAFDIEIMNIMAELDEYHQQAGFFLSKVNWDKVAKAPLKDKERFLDLVEQIGQSQGWKNWNFESPYK